ncbi:MAG: OB-fold nucleic acid binding domain-containing protein, partial [Actinomycetota bacterium]
HLPGMQPVEEAIADMWATGIAPNGHPTEFLRAELTRMGVVTAEGLWDRENESKVLVAGIVTHRQRPSTAHGVTFMNLEDETGHINVVCSQGCWVRYRREASGAAALLLRGRLEMNEGVINVIAEHMKSLIVGVRASARNFR